MSATALRSPSASSPPRSRRGPTARAAPSSACWRAVGRRPSWPAARATGGAGSWPLVLVAGLVVACTLLATAAVARFAGGAPSAAGGPARPASLGAAGVAHARRGPAR